MGTTNAAAKLILAGVAVCAVLVPLAHGDYAGNGALDWTNDSNANQYVRVADDASLRPPAITIELWVKPSSFEGHLFGKPRGTGVQDDYAAWFRESGGVLQLAWICANFVQVPNPLSLGEWNHVAFTSGPASHAIYVNGQLVASVSGAAIVYETNPLYIGSDSNNGVIGPPFRGVVDEVRIWSVNRSASQIASTMTTALHGDEEGLVAYWRFDEGAGQFAADLTANENTGQLGSTSGPAPMWTTSGAPIDLPPPQCDADLSQDGVVDGSDLGLLLGLWGNTNPVLPADLNGDGAIDGADLGLLLGAWGPCP